MEVLAIIILLFLLYKAYERLIGVDRKSQKNEKQRRDEMLKKEREREIILQKKLLEYISSDEELGKKLEDFISDYSKKYDFGEIGYKEYESNISLLLKYLNKRISLIVQKEQDKNLVELKKEFGNIPFKLIYEAIEYYIDKNKIKIYSKDMKSALNKKKFKNTKELAKYYISVFGEKSLNETNIKTLSFLTHKDYEILKEKVNIQYRKIQEEYEIKRMEAKLFRDKKNLDINYIDSLTGFEFEDFLKELFNSYGYSVQDLPYSNDYGADLIINKGIKKVVIQAKNYNGSVGNKAVQEVVSAKVYYKCDIAIVITNSYFTQNALETAKKSNVIMVNRDELEEILEKGQMYFNSLIN